MAHARTMMSDVTFAEDAYSCAQGADALVIVTEWNAFRALDLNRIRQTMQAGPEGPVLIDLRNIYDLKHIERHGFVYEAVGRATSVRVK
jgi:UDPglucose 6-dehydrogenase